MIVKYKNKGEEVKVIQQALQNKGYSIKVDGIFGKETKTAVQKFQNDNGLKPDGIVGSTTWEILVGIQKYEIIEHDKQTLVIKIAKDKIQAIDVLQPPGYGKTVKEVYNGLSLKPHILINGSLFNMENGEVLTKLIDNYNRIGNWEYFNNFCLISNDGKNIEFRPLSAKEMPKEALGLVPSLIINGKKNIETKGLDTGFVYSKHPRLAIGHDDTFLYIVIVHGRKIWLGHKGCTIDELAKICLAYKMKDAGNLDGGGSIAAVNEYGHYINKPLESRRVDNLLAFYLK